MVLYIEYTENADIGRDALYKEWATAKIEFLFRKEAFLSLRNEKAVKLWTIDKDHFAWKHADDSDNTIYHVQLIQL